MRVGTFVDVSGCLKICGHGTPVMFWSSAGIPWLL
jgi:hypothetical protein